MLDLKKKSEDFSQDFGLIQGEMPLTNTNVGCQVDGKPEPLLYIDDSDMESDRDNVTDADSDSDIGDKRQHETNNASFKDGVRNSDNNDTSEPVDSGDDNDGDHKVDSQSTTETRDVNVISMMAMQMSQAQTKPPSNPTSNEDQNEEIRNSSPDIVKEDEDVRDDVSDDGGVNCDFIVSYRRQTLRHVRSSRDEDDDAIITPGGKRYRPDTIDECTDTEQTDRAERQSCSSETSEENDLVESKIAQLSICRRSKFVKIDSRTSRHDGKKLTRHYVTRENKDTDITGDIGLQPLDELLHVNGKSLKNVKQKKVKKIFKKIRLNQETNEVKIELKIRRWVASDQPGPMHERKWTTVKEVLIKMTLIPDQTDIIPRHHKQLARRQSFKVERINRSIRKEDPLNLGYIRVHRIGSVKTNTIKSNFANRFVSNVASQDAFVGLSVITNEITCRYDVESFSGEDLSPKSAFGSYLFCVRFRVQRPGGNAFLCSNIQGGDDKVKFVVRDDDFQSIKDPDTLDERCFIVRSIGGSDLFQSLIYRDRFIAYDENSGYLYMKQIPHKQQEAFISGEEHRKKRNDKYITSKKAFEPCWFSRSNPNPSFHLHQRLGKYFQSLLCGVNRNLRVEDL